MENREQGRECPIHKCWIDPKYADIGLEIACPKCLEEWFNANYEEVTPDGA